MVLPSVHAKFQKGTRMNREDAEKYWTDIISDSRTYASGVAAYCRDKHLSVKNYYVWFAKLKEAHPEWLNKAKQDADVTKEIRPKSIKTRRFFSAVEKSRILDEVDAAHRGEIGAILRREGIYSATLQKWKTERAQRSLEPRKRGPKENPEAKEIKRLNAEVEKLTRRLEQAEDIIEVQKKIASILGKREPDKS